MPEVGAMKVWLVAFVVCAVGGLGALVGIGCAVGGNSCPFSSGGNKPPDGRGIWIANCGPCHGMDGRGTNSGPSLVSGQHATVTQERMIDQILKGAPQKNMPPYKGVLNQKQIDAVVKYAFSLRETK